MLVGIVGAPNKGKSTLFSALTLNDVAIADYPFTTIDPNKGIAYATVMCACSKLGVRCHARNGLCKDSVRFVPVNVVDVAGLVEDAHVGKGMGNKFLNDIAAADALIIVADASGKTDPAGNPAIGADPVTDVEMVESELAEWLADIVMRHMPQMSRRDDAAGAIADVLAGVMVDKATIEAAINKAGLLKSRINWNESDALRFSTELIALAKPRIIVANKMDASGAREGFSKLSERFGKDSVVGMSAAVELALSKAEHAGVIKRADRGFEIIGNPSTEQRSALEYMRRFASGETIGTHDLINRVVFGLLGYIVVYPVEDENKYTDGSGNILPDAVLLRKGSTARELAYKIHTDIGARMLHAIDCRTKMMIAKDHVLNDGDVVKIVSTAR